MELREFGKAGVKIAPVGMGTYFDPVWITLAMIFRIRLHAKSSIQALQIGLDAGFNLIDTAEIYQSEPLVATAIKGRKRDELFIASKVWSSHLNYDGVLSACEKSLRRVKTSYIDLYQIHWPNNRVPIRETMSAMEKLVDQGKVKHIGVSNFSLKQMQEAQFSISKYELASTQMNYSLTHRDVERDILPYCEKEKIAVLAYYPLAHGRLASSKKMSDNVFSQISKRHLGKTPAQIALNWLLAGSEVLFPIPRASNPVHVKENVGSVGWRLEKSEMELLTHAFPA